MQPSDRKRDSVTAGTIARYTLVVLAIWATTLFIWEIKGAFLMAFAGVILAIILTRFAGFIQKHLPLLSRSWALGFVAVIVLTVFGLFGLIFGPQIITEFQELREKLPQQIAELRETISDWPLGDELLDGEALEEENNEGEQGQQQQDNGGQEGQNDEETGGGLLQDTGGMIFYAGATIVDVISTLLIIFVTGIYFAIDPHIYKKGVALLFTKKRADRISEALETTGNALWQWLSGQFMAMAFVGVFCTIGLMIIGVPLALVLGLIAGLLEFIPIIGPWVAAIPGILLAFSVGTDTAFYAGIMYLLVQQLESNVLTPLIQRHMVYIPPAVVILSVVAFGVVFGVAGIILATPLAVVAMVLIGMFYVEDVLDKEVEIPGRKPQE